MCLNAAVAGVAHPGERMPREAEGIAGLAGVGHGASREEMLGGHEACSARVGTPEVDFPHVKV